MSRFQGCFVQRGSAQCLGHHLPLLSGWGSPRFTPNPGLSPRGWLGARTAAVPAGGAHKLPFSSRRKASKNRGCPDAEGFPQSPAPLFHSLLLPGDRTRGSLIPGQSSPCPKCRGSPSRSPAPQQTLPQQGGLAQTHLPRLFCPVHSPPPSPTAPPSPSLHCARSTHLPHTAPRASVGRANHQGAFPKEQSGIQRGHPACWDLSRGTAGGAA